MPAPSGTQPGGWQWQKTAALRLFHGVRRVQDEDRQKGH
jgi:hypothetical protein